MHEFPAESFFVVTLETQIGRLTLQGILIITLVGVMATDAVTIQNRLVDTLLQHHVAAGFVTAKAQFFLGRKEFEFMILSGNRNMADGTDSRTHRTVNISLGTHIGMALGRKTRGIALPEDVTGTKQECYQKREKYG